MEVRNHVDLSSQAITELFLDFVRSAPDRIDHICSIVGRNKRTINQWLEHGSPPRIGEFVLKIEAFLINEGVIDPLPPLDPENIRQCLRTALLQGRVTSEAMGIAFGIQNPTEKVLSDRPMIATQRLRAQWFLVKNGVLPITIFAELPEYVLRVYAYVAENLDTSITELAEKTFRDIKGGSAIRRLIDSPQYPVPALTQKAILARLPAADLSIAAPPSADKTVTNKLATNVKTISPATDSDPLLRGLSLEVVIVSLASSLTSLLDAALKATGGKEAKLDQLRSTLLGEDRRQTLFALENGLGAINDSDGPSFRNWWRENGK